VSNKLKYFFLIFIIDNGFCTEKLQGDPILSSTVLTPSSNYETQDYDLSSYKKRIKNNKRKTRELKYRRIIVEDIAEQVFKKNPENKSVFPPIYAKFIKYTKDQIEKNGVILEDISYEDKIAIIENNTRYVIVRNLKNRPDYLKIKEVLSNCAKKKKLPDSNEVKSAKISDKIWEIENILRSNLISENIKIATKDVFEGIKDEIAKNYPINIEKAIMIRLNKKIENTASQYFKRLKQDDIDYILREIII